MTFEIKCDMEQKLKKGFCICLMAGGETIQKINGFPTIEEAKSFLKVEFSDFFKEDFEDFRFFCENDERACAFRYSDFSFIHIRPSVWDENQRNEYNG